jgi:hypothetical protein
MFVFMDPVRTERLCRALAQRIAQAYGATAGLSRRARYPQLSAGPPAAGTRLNSGDKAWQS